MKKICKLAILLSIILTFNACKKDTALQEVKNTDPTEQKILNFKAKLQNPNKSNESMSIDSAVWYIEAALNYTYCYRTEEVPKVNFLKIDTFTINADYEGDEINYTEIYTTYNLIKNYTLSFFQNFNGIDKIISAVDIDFKDNKFSSKIILGYNIPEENKNYVSGWIWGMKLGSCDGQYVNKKDASTEINRYLKRTYPQAEINGYWTDLEFSFFDSYNAYAPLVSNNGPWYSAQQSPVGNNVIVYLEITNDNNFDRCLTIGDSYEWYKQRAWTAVQGAKDYLDNHYAGTTTHRIMKFYFFTNRRWYWNTSEYQTHRIEFTYGIPHAGAPIK